MAAELATTLAPESDDDRLEQAEAAVRAYCGWHIAPSRTETATFIGDGSAAILLKSLHVTGVASVTVDGVLLDSGDYSWSEAGVLTRACGPCCRGWRGSVVVVFTHGYDPVPADVTAAVQGLALRGIDNPKSLKSWTRGPFSETYGDGSDGSSALNRYKLPPRP